MAEIECPNCFCIVDMPEQVCNLPCSVCGFKFECGETYEVDEDGHYPYVAQTELDAT